MSFLRHLRRLALVIGNALFRRLISVTRKMSATGTQLGATSYGYDAFGRVQSLTDARNGTTWFTYNDAGQIVSTTTPEPGNGQPAQTTSTVFDAQGRALRVTDPDGTTVTNEYTLAGQLKKTYGSRAYPVEYTFDAQGRMKTMTSWQDFSGDSGTATTTWHYDTQRGWLTNKSYADGLGATYTNTPAGRLKWRQWARGVTTTYGYSPEGELAAVNYSDSTPDITYGYDSLGRQIAVTNGTVVCLRSNNLVGALLSEKWQGGPLDGWWVTNHFDSLQRRDCLQVFSGSTNRIQQNYAYDAASRMTQVWQGGYGASYAYLANSPLVAQISFANNGTGILTTVKQYDHLNRLSAISSGTGVALVSSHAYLHNAANQRVQANREDGAYWRYEYDKLGQVVSGKKCWQDGTPVPGMQFEYGFDDIGNRKSTAAGGNQSGAGLRPPTYRPNLLNQYTNRTVPGGFDVLGAASATNAVTVNGSPADYRHGEFFQELLTVNNTNATLWQSVKVTNTTSGAYETGAVLLAQSPESFTHDADGNLTSDGRWDYTWDGENRVVQMETRSAAYNAGAPRQKLLFGYDWQGRRISKTVSNWVSGNWALASTRSFIYDGWNLLAILNPPSSILQQFMWGLDLSGGLQGAGGVGGLVKVHDATTGKNYFPAYDGNGNVLTLLDSATGAEAARYEYGPFGEPLAMAGSYAQSNPFRFSTKFTDEETGCLYYGYRSYNPITGRWLSRDPYGERGGLNEYCANLNNCIANVDFLGLSCDITAWFIAGKWVADPMKGMLGFSFTTVITWLCHDCSKECCAPFRRVAPTYKVDGKVVDVEGKPANGSWRFDYNQNIYNDHCVWGFVDSPGASKGLRPGKNVDLSFTYNVFVRDMCNRGKVVFDKVFSAKVTGTYPDNLVFDPPGFFLLESSPGSAKDLMAIPQDNLK